MRPNSKTLDDIVTQFTKDQIYDLYWTQHLSTRNLAVKLGTSQPTARRVLTIFNIPRKTRADIELHKVYQPLNEEHKRKIKESYQQNKANHKLRRGKDHPHFNSSIKNCNYCNKENYYPLGFANQKHFFCNHECHSKWLKDNVRKGEDSPLYTSVNVSCEWCQASLIRKKSQVNKKYGNFCNNKCFGLFQSKYVVGDKNQNFKGGYKEYYGPSWEFQCKTARNRDGNTCQRCGRDNKDMGKNLDVHHIQPFRLFGVENHIKANNLSNLITYCNQCHSKVEANPNNKFAFPFQI